MSFEDNMYGVDGNGELFGLRDEVDIDLAVGLDATAADDLNNWADAIAVSLLVPLPLAFSDSFTLTDAALVVRIPETLDLSASDDLNLWADTLSFTLAGDTTVLPSQVLEITKEEQASDVGTSPDFLEIEVFR